MTAWINPFLRFPGTPHKLNEFTNLYLITRLRLLPLFSMKLLVYLWNSNSQFILHSDSRHYSRLLPKLYLRTFITARNKTNLLKKYTTGKILRYSCYSAARDKSRILFRFNYHYSSQKKIISNPICDIQHKLNIKRSRNLAGLLHYSKPQFLSAFFCYCRGPGAPHSRPRSGIIRNQGFTITALVERFRVKRVRPTAGHLVVGRRRFPLA